MLLRWFDLLSSENDKTLYLPDMALERLIGASH
jgi:hypothetical protein